jgi:hypothetical protein
MGTTEMTTTTIAEADVGRLLAQVPPAWVAPVQWLGASIGSAWDRVKGSLYLRLISYADDGYELDDVKAACRVLCHPEVQARCDWPDHWLKEFAAAIATAKGRREAAAKRAELEKYVNSETPEQRAANMARLRKWKKENLSTFFVMPMD